MPTQFRLSRVRVLGLVIPLAVAKGQGPPATDIFVASLTRSDGRLSVGPARNVTAREGYDNQPAWSAGTSSLYYTSNRDGQTDIYRVNLSSGATYRVTTTPESEYSATLTPARNAISVIRVERDSTQRLWQFPLNGGAPSLVLERVKPVGYHAWADSVTLALFVLGTPNTLQLANTRTGKADTIETNIGRSLHAVPGQRRISYVQKVSDDEWWIVLLDPVTRARQRLVRLPKGVEDYAWTPDGLIVAGEGSVLKVHDPRRGGWETVGDLAPSGVTSITRLAVSPNGDQIAIVAVPAAK